MDLRVTVNQIERDAVKWGDIGYECLKRRATLLYICFLEKALVWLLIRKRSATYKTPFSPKNTSIQAAISECDTWV